MRIVCISDTHGKHRELTVPPGDLLLHAGDISSMGLASQIADFLDWFSAQPHPHKVFIAGNHDFLAERDNRHFRSLIPGNLHYLQESRVEIEGISIWGSPITPWFHDWAFNRRRGEVIRQHWERIPAKVDILLTHGPAYGIRDLTFRGELVGCEELNAKVWQVQPKLHLFGHIHEAYGVTVVNDILFANAANLDLANQVAFPPLVFEW